MYTVIIHGEIETWERTFTDIYEAIKCSEDAKSKGFTTEIVEAY